ncbi:MAG TPA: cytochrome c biogenesis protein CcdA [Candidatus Jorgensenbacteria bacterium]|nr:cytochrome c biogenesis protein CcdA [Candidatus Jorgensenbacteria bacterium]
MTQQPLDQLTTVQKKTRTYLVVAFFILTAVFLVGIFWLASTPGQTVGLTLAFAAGLSMIVLPCTFPLVFVIVPLAMGKSPKKGLLMAVLFGLGLIITLSIYGVVVAWAGQIFGLASVSKWMFLVAGVAALLFGLSELGLIHLKLPYYKGATPQFVQKQGDYLKAFFMGLFLGNAGIACPNPATYVILTYIASSGSIAYGAALQAVNGLGRFLPLLAVTILAIAGVNASMWFMRKKEAIQKATAWMLIVVGAFVVVWGIYGHFWFLNTPLHSGWTRWFGTTISSSVAEYECCINPPCGQCLDGWIWGPGVCECRIHLEQGHLDQVCPECRVGLAEGKGVFDIAKRTEKPALALLGGLILGPAVWYIAKRRFSKKEDDEDGSKETTEIKHE